MGTIAWRTIGDSNLTRSKDCCTTRSKFAYRWTATGNGRNLNDGDDIKCLHCNGVEDHVHVLKCGAHSAVTTRASLLETLKDTRVSIATHPDLVTLVRKISAAVDDVVIVDLDDHSQKNDVTRMIRQQNKIGCYQFFSEFWT